MAETLQQKVRRFDAFKKAFKKNPELTIFNIEQHFKAVAQAEISARFEAIKEKQLKEIEDAKNEALSGVQREFDAMRPTLKGVKGDTPKVDVDFKQPKPGPRGHTPIAGRDYLIPNHGKTPVKGVDYFTDSEQKEFLAEVIKALPKSKHFTGEDIIKKINESKGIIKRDRSEEPDIEFIDKKLPKRKGYAGEWGPRVFDATPESFAVDSSTTTITLKSHPVAGGKMLWLFYNGQFLHQGVHYSIDARVITFLSALTLDDGTVIDALYLHR